MTADAARDWEFALLGNLEVRHRGEVVPIPAEKQRTLLATLLLRRSAPVQVRDLADRIWSDPAPLRSGAAVHSLVMRLRRALSQDGAGDGLIRTVAQGYALEVPAEAIDLARFDALRGRAVDADLAGDQSLRAELLREALALWRGDPLADLTSEVLHREEVPALAERWVHTCEEYVDAERELGRYLEVVGLLREATTRHPLREGLWARLMVALFRGGRQAEALDVYRQLAAMLVEEFGLDPSPELRQLQLAIFNGDTELSHLTPTTTRYSPQAPASAAGPWFQLPAEPGPLHGRDGHVSAVLEVIGDGTGNRRLPVVCLSGAPGVGKTALAVHLAHRLRARFPDGQWHIRLRTRQTGDRDPADVLAELLNLAGIRGAALPDGLDARTAAWRTALADRKILLLLDDAASAEQVAPLLPGNAGCAVLVTSRSKLGGLVAQHGGRAINVDTLSPDDATALLAAAFDEHGITAAPGVIQELAKLCGYLPLALRIAAANVATNAPHPPTEYLRQLRAQDRLTALEVEGDAQACIRAAFEPSYHGLSTPARRALRLLASTPTDDFTRYDLAALIGADPPLAESVLRQLNTANLIRPSAPGRFELHDLIRLYASEQSQLSDTELDRESALARLFDSYLTATDAAARQHFPRLVSVPALKVTDDPPRADLETWFPAEYRNLVAAIQHAADHGPPQIAWLLAGRLRGYQQARGVHADWRRCAEAGLAQAQHEQSDLGVAAMHLSLATLGGSRSDYADARHRFQLSLAIYTQLGNLIGQASASNNLGIVQREVGNLTDARTSYDRAMRLYREIGNRRAELSSLSNLSVVQLELDQISEAIRSQAEALAGHESLGTSGLDDDVGTSLHNLGVATRAHGLVGMATMYLTRALAIRRRIGSLYGQANDLDSLAACYVDLGYPTKAMGLIDECLTLARRIGRVRLESEALNTRGRAMLALGDPAAAIAEHQTALELSRGVGYRRAEIEALLGLGFTYRASGQEAEARQQFEAAEQVANDSQHYRFARQAAAALS